MRRGKEENQRNAEAMWDVLSEAHTGGGVNLMPAIILPRVEGVMLFRRHERNLARAYGCVGVRIHSASRTQPFLMEQS